MSTLTVWKFQGPETAEQSLEKILGLQQQELITVDDAAYVTWEVGAKGPKTKQMNNLAGAGAVGGLFWGMLFGLIFLIPFIGAAIGALTGALSGALSDFGIDDRFIDTVREKVTPGTSALFLLSEGAVVDRIQEAFAGTSTELIASNLSSEQEANLAKLFA